jgi:glycosidase
MKVPKSIIWKMIKKSTRDHARTPMQWNTDANAGFSSSLDTWIRVNPNFHEINVETEDKTRESVLNFYKHMIDFRNTSDILQRGDYILKINNGKLAVIERNYNNKTLYLVLNFSSSYQKLTIDGRLLLSSNYNRDTQLGSIITSINLYPYEGAIIS